MSHFDTGIVITAFSIPHIVYCVLIIGSFAACRLVTRHKIPEAKEKVLRFLAYALVLVYGIIHAIRGAAKNPPRTNRPRTRNKTV